MSPAITAGLTDHVWTTNALLSCRVSATSLVPLHTIEHLFPRWNALYHGNCRKVWQSRHLWGMQKSIVVPMLDGMDSACGWGCVLQWECRRPKRPRGADRRGAKIGCRRAVAGCEQRRMVPHTHRASLLAHGVDEESLARSSLRDDRRAGVSRGGYCGAVGGSALQSAVWRRRRACGRPPHVWRCAV